MAEVSLFMLLLPAPLLSNSRVRGVFSATWQAHGTIRKTAIDTAKSVTAFTIGHSLTLVASVLGSFSASSRMSAGIEVLIATSILVSAIHALRPLFPVREAWIAGFFGFIHGLAFASALSAFGFDRTTSYHCSVSTLASRRCR
jgi:hypothetical protein